MVPKVGWFNNITNAYLLFFCMRERSFLRNILVVFAQLRLFLLPIRPV